MNVVFKTILIVGIFAGIGVAIQQFVGSSFDNNINSAFLSFLTMMKPVDFIIPVATVYACMQLLGNFIFGVAGFYIIRWVTHLLAA